MRTLEIRMEHASPNLFERFAGMRVVYATTISDGALEVVGRGPTPEVSHEAAHTQWEFAQLADAAVMYP
jgi:hypothetical protein